MRQLMENQITGQLVMTRASSMENMFVMLSITDKTSDESMTEFRTRIRSACNREMKRINDLEKSLKPNDFALTIERLIESRHEYGNEETQREHARETWPNEHAYRRPWVRGRA